MTAMDSWRQYYEKVIKPERGVDAERYGDVLTALANSLFDGKTEVDILDVAGLSRI